MIRRLSCEDGGNEDCRLGVKCLDILNRALLEVSNKDISNEIPLVKWIAERVSNNELLKLVIQLKL